MIYFWAIPNLSVRQLVVVVLQIKDFQNLNKKKQEVLILSNAEMHWGTDFILLSCHSTLLLEDLGCATVKFIHLSQHNFTQLMNNLWCNLGNYGQILVLTSYPVNLNIQNELKINSFRWCSISKRMLDSPICYVTWNHTF